MKYKIQLLLLACFLSVGSSSANAKDETAKDSDTKATFSTEVSTPEEVASFMSQLKGRIENREFNWDLSLFTAQGWKSRGKTVNGLPLIYWTCGDEKNAENRSLILSAVHGDEITPVHFGFRMVEWLKARKDTLCDKNFVVVAPIVNPDGFLRYRRGTRTNYNKVDLNRNFDTPEWRAEAHKRWKQQTIGGEPQRRYYPGDRPGSEPEIHFQKWLIEEYRPSKIMSVHAPLKFLDFDGPDTEQMKIFARDYIDAVEAMKKKLEASTHLLKFHVYGTFPGSLGNYAGKQKGIPTITTELPTSNALLAGKYFGDLEKSTEVFLQFDFSAKNSKQSLSQNN